MNDDVERVAGGYDTVYAAISGSPAFHRIWREHAMGADFPAGFEHISFLTLDEMQRMAAELRLNPTATLVDLGCGMGGPGLLIARETGARLTGVDVSSVALEQAGLRAASVGLSEKTDFVSGSFAETTLAATSADGAMTVDALQYAPDKRAAVSEAARILRPGGRIAFTVFELDPERVRGLPVFGTDAVDDYGPLLEQTGFDVTAYEETPGWRERLTGAYQAVLDARTVLVEELGEPAYNALSGEMTLTLQLQPYRRRVFVAATKR